MTSANDVVEIPSRIEPARLENAPEAIVDVSAELSAASASLGARLHPSTAASLAEVVRMVNSHYSNLIEGSDTPHRDIERALRGEFDQVEGRRNQQIEAAVHVRLQEKIDRMAAEQRLPEPASCNFIRWLHSEFYRDAPEAMRVIESNRVRFRMAPGEWRSEPAHDVSVGRHFPPLSHVVESFMAHFERQYRFEGAGRGTRILFMAAAHHRFNYIHPFPDGNGRVSRLMSHAMALKAGIGAHGLWSISRGLARGLESRREYKALMDHADSPRHGDLDGREILSHQALVDFTLWFLKVCLDQVTFMAELFDFDSLDLRLLRHVDRSDKLKPEAGCLLREALLRGQFERGEASRITGLSERSARRVLADVVATGLLASVTPKGPVSLRFPLSMLDQLFPRLYPEIQERQPTL